MAPCLFEPFTSYWKQILPKRWPCVVQIKRLKVILWRWPTVTSLCLWGEAAGPGAGRPSEDGSASFWLKKNDPLHLVERLCKNRWVKVNRVGDLSGGAIGGSADPRGRALWPSQLAAGEIGTRCRPHCVYLCTFDSCWPTFHLATRTRVTEFANRIWRTLFNFYFYPGYLYIVTIEQKDNVDVNSAHSSSGATPDIPPLCDEAGSHVARGEESSVSRPDTTDTREEDMSLTNVPSPESVVYDGVATSTAGPFPPLSGVFREQLGDLSRDPIISSNISNWESTLQSTISGLGQQMISIANKIDNNTKMLQDQISLSECRTNSHLKSLERNVSSLENNVSSLQKDVHIFQIQTDSKLNEINGKILQLDTNILNVDSKLTSFQISLKPCMLNFQF